MASGAKSIVINREDDWKDRSVLSHVGFKDDILISENKSGENGVYISKSFDSNELETAWHRLRIKADIPSNGVMKLKVYASDSKETLVPSTDGKGMNRIDIDEYISDQNIDINRKVDMFDYIGAKLYENPNDVLMFDQVGRYLWICIELINYSKSITKIESMKIEYPRVSFVDYLPEIYREKLEKDSFLPRFMGIFQNIYVDLEDRIDFTPMNFDPNTTNKDFLNWLADWFSIKDTSIWGESKLRILINEAVKIYKMKGTKRAVAKIVKSYVGVEPIIVEKFDIKENQYYSKNKDEIDQLFGDNGFMFTVILNEKDVKSSEEYVELIRVINSVKPIDCICNLVVLTNKIYLGHHCYLGINSYIAKNEEMVIGNNYPDSNTLVLVDKK